MRAGIFAAFILLLAAALLLLVFGPITYVREAREFRPEPVAAAGPETIRVGELQPGLPLPRPAPNTGGENPSWYERNAVALSEGQRLYSAFNCVGCHSHGGGGMGPPLMDGKWRYGGRIDQIATSIYQGRPNGMPSWRYKLTEEQVWQLAADVRTLSGQVPKDAVSARPDTMSNTPPNTQTRREDMLPSDAAKK